MDGAFVVAFANLGDILGDVDFSRAGLAAGRQAIAAAIKVHQAFRQGFDFHDIFRANGLAGTATNTIFFDHHRVPLRSHFKGIELTGINAVAQTDATDRTFSLAAG